MDLRTTTLIVFTVLFIPIFVSADLCYTGGTYNEANLQGYADTGPNMAGQVITMTTGFTLDGITARTRRNGGRTDNAYYSLYSTTAGTPNAELKACNTVSIGSSFQWATSTCDSTHFDAGTYALVLKAATNEGNNFHVANASAGASWDYVGGSWGPGNNDTLNLAVQLYCTPDTESEPIFFATSTDDYSQAHRNLQNGIILFLIGFFGVIWLIRKH